MARLAKVAHLVIAASPRSVPDPRSHGLWARSAPPAPPAKQLLGAIGEADLPLPITDPCPALRRRVTEACYDIGAQLAHFADARF